MKIAVMQPYLFPYIGYWQLLYAVDRFVILDDVNYIKRGYINRNQILLEGKPFTFTIPVKKASQNRLIQEMELQYEEKDRKKLLATFIAAYKKAPFFPRVMPLVENVILNEEGDLVEYIRKSMELIMQYLDIHTEIYRSSLIEKDNALRSQERIIEICRKMQADIYVNPCGGRELYSHDRFQREKIKLYFLDTRKSHICYDQKMKEFIPNLSIIDVMMFNDVPGIQRFLKEYDLNG